MERKYLMILIAILALSFAFRIAAINYEWIDVDEGNYLYDAKLLSDGAKPFEDFYMKEVFYTSLLAGAGKAFGFTLFLGRLLSAVFSIITIIFIYKIGKELNNPK